ncbi:MAG: UDP-2,3-diacylglucosamine diphosphatase [Bacteroidia bacterium]
MKKKKLHLVCISDVHLGTYGCRAKELNKYLKSIDPEILILNGDIVDVWQFSKNYWPDSHMKIIQRILKMLANGTQVYYLTGNHDEILRKFTDFKMGKLEILNKLVLNLDGKKAWFFHGDVFDITMKHSKWLAKLGAVGYDTLILLNSAVNWISKVLGRGKISLSKNIKNGVKSAIKFVSDFEQTAIEIAIEKGYDYVVCGHIHQPQMREVKTNAGSTIYLNSGDWIENLTALEYDNGKWEIIHFHETIDTIEDLVDQIEDELNENSNFNPEKLLQTILK